MHLLRKLSWFFKLEKKRYFIGIGALILVSFLNLIPPRIMGLVIDLIDKRRLTLSVGREYWISSPSSPCHVWTSFCLETLYFWDG